MKPSGVRPMETVEELRAEVDRLTQELNSEKAFYKTLSKQNESLVKKLIKMRELLARAGYGEV